MDNLIFRFDHRGYKVQDTETRPLGRGPRGHHVWEALLWGVLLGLFLGGTVALWPGKVMASKPSRTRRRVRRVRTRKGEVETNRARGSGSRFGHKASRDKAAPQSGRRTWSRHEAERRARLAARLVSKTLERFGWEPSVREVQHRALKHAGLGRSRITAARIRGAAALPEIRFGVDLGRVQTSSSRQEAGSPVRMTDRYDSDRAWTLEARWRLHRLIFDPNELKLQSQAMRRRELREEILAQVTRLYFLRRRLQALEILQPARTLRTELARRLSIQRLTGELDRLTGGWFSEELRRRLSGR